MEKYIFKRVLHPVGQGAFFTEQFYDSNENIIFNVVYDCGEMRTKRHLEKEIDNTLNVTGKPEVVDVMFISHLDEDHINGIDYLVKLGCLTKRSLVILPLHYPLVLKLILQQLGNNGLGKFGGGTAAILSSLFNSEAKILGIDDNEEQLKIDSLRIDEGLLNVNNYSQIKSMQPLVYKDLWYYLPFNTILDDERYQKFLNALAAAKIDRNLLADFDYVQKHLDTLIDIYRSLPQGIGKVTAINVNSLNVLSYCTQREGLSFMWLNYLVNGCRWCYPWNYHLACDNRCSCLYTGDCVMDAHFNKCLDALVKYINAKIGMLQIPHHGRQSCYDKATACRSEIITGFTNFNSTHKKNRFVKQIVHDFSVTGRMLFQITEHFHSRMEMYVEVIL